MLYLFFIVLLAATFLAQVVLAREEEPDIRWHLIPDLASSEEDADRPSHKEAETALVSPEEDGVRQQWQAVKCLFRTTPYSYQNGYGFVWVPIFVEGFYVTTVSLGGVDEVASWSTSDLEVHLRARVPAPFLEGHSLRMIAPEVARTFITSPSLLDLFDEYLVFVQQRPESSLEHFRCHRANEQLLAQIRQEEADSL